MCRFRDQTFAFCENCEWVLKVAQKRGRYVYKDTHEQAGKEAFVASSNENLLFFYLYDALEFRWCTENNKVESFARREVLKACNPR